MEANDYILFDDDDDIHIWVFNMKLSIWGGGMLNITDITIAGTHDTGFSTDAKTQTQSTFPE
jgi:hypothetical protein